MLYNICHVMLCYVIICPMLCYITCVILCYITCDMLCYITCDMQGPRSNVKSGRADN